MSARTVFLSSTGADLRDYRIRAFEAIAKLDDWKCVRMEDFQARTLPVDEFCREMAASCDLFIGIIGHRFGEGPTHSEDPAASESFTQREYRAAVKAGKPRLLFFAPDDFPIPANVSESDEKIRRQAAFRAELRSSKDVIVSTRFSSPDNLAAQIVTGIYHWKQKSAGPGPEGAKTRSSGPESSASGASDRRNRLAMIQRVRADWIDGVLKRSLYEAARIEWSLEKREAEVDAALNAVVQVRKRAPEPIPPNARIVDIFDQEGQSLLILGEPGTGKTTLLLELAQGLLDRALLDEGLPIPVVFNLSTWGIKRAPLADWLIWELNARSGVSKALARKWLENGEVIPLLDGLDEVDSQHRPACLDAINEFRQRGYGLVPIAVCSRIGEYSALGRKLQLHTAILVQTLTGDQVNRCLGRRPEWIPLLETGRQDASLAELLKTPLFLWVAILAYRQFPLVAVSNEGLVGERHRLFASFAEEMLGRRAQTPWRRDDVLRWLTCLAGIFQLKQLTILYLEDLHQTWFPKSVPRLLLPFAVVLACALACGTVSVAVGMTGMLVFGQHSGLRECLAFLVMGGLIGIVIGCLGEMIAEPRPVEAIRFNWDEIRTQSRDAGVAAAYVGLIVSVGVGAVFALILGLRDGARFGALAGVSVGLIVGLVRLLTVERVELRGSTNQGLRDSVKNAILMLVVIGLVVGLRGGISVGPGGGLLSGIASGLCGGMYGGGTFAVRHAVLRLFVAATGVGPLDYVAFLDFATERLFVQKSGGGFRFTHLMIQNYFASRSAME